jgi:ribonuclease T1
LRRALAALAIFCVAAVLASSGEIRTAELPPEARQALERIKAGGPFSSPNDDRTFNNREARLPKHARGYYREYTVRTPGMRDRGARRIVAGRGGELYYTEDHYRTFKRIIE